MGIYQRGDCWYIDYRAYGRRMREKVGPDRRFAELALKKRQISVAENRFLDIKKREKIRFEDFAKTYLELHSKVNKRPMVARRDFFLIKRLGTHFNGKYLYEITPQSIERYKSERIKDRAPATVNRELACLKCMFNKAITWGKAEDNPVRKVKLFKENNKRLRYLEKEEINKLLDNAQAHLRPILIVALFTGMRRSEIFNLRWKDLNIEHNIISIPQTKSGERQEIPMSGVVKKTLIAVLKNPDSPYVFCNKWNKPYTNVRKSFDAALKKCGIIDFHFHDLRHSFASQLVMAGVDIKTVQELLRHKSIEMTMRYAHLSPMHKMKAVEVLDRQLVTGWSQEPKSDILANIGSFSNSMIQKELVH